LSRDSTRRFTQRADFYARYRPGYPPEILGILEREIGFSPRDIVADIGSGTGLLTKLFLQNGNRVFAVEPNGKMRRHAEKGLGGFRNFVSVNGTAEHTALKTGTVDLISVGQALHWFDSTRTVREFSRISRPDGHLCIAYNERKGNDRFGRAYGKVIKRNERDRASVPNADDKYISHFFDGGRYSKFAVPNEQLLDFEGLMGRLLSASYMPPPGEKKGFARMRSDVRALFDEFNRGGRVRLRYSTNVFVGLIRRPPQSS
jgi:SAM-dependent methyltransferase